MLIKNRYLIASLFSILSFSTFAAAPPTHKVVTKTCLLKSLSTPLKPIAKAKDFVLLNATETDIQALAEAKKRQKSLCGGFVDVTFEWTQFNQKEVHSPVAFLQTYIKTKPDEHLQAPLEYKTQYQKQVNQLLQKLNPQNMWGNLTTLTAYLDRYANSENGVQAANWLKDRIETMAKNNGRDDVSVELVSTGFYKQPSVVAKIGNGTGPAIVVGGHMDTLSSSWEIKPGADDDGTGTVTVLELARRLIKTDMRFKKPVYVIWYAAEEMGLVGSGYVVQHFKQRNIPVAAVLQLDMTGYAYQDESTMWLINDYVNKDLTAYLEKLITTYVKKPVQYTQCGYACSDHASWNKAGVAAAFPFEAKFGQENPYIHRSSDIMAHLSLTHMTSFLKLATAFVVELAEPTS